MHTGDTSGQSEPLFSSLEEPLLTAIQIDSEHDGTELELTSCSMYSRPDMNLQDSTEVGIVGYVFCNIFNCGQ